MVYTKTIALASAFLCIMIMTPMAQSPPLIEECGCIISLRDAKMSADCSIATDLKCLAELRNVQILNISGIGLTEVPEDLNSTGFENIFHLDLSNNNISNIPSWKFDAMPQLHSINLSYNHITKLPDEACRINSV
ncbi:phospholipase A2 inhibitor-like [Drosophila takahashii]|uniref:phospholipase A2 inhibitor-like n=1 Tax=Drosophila takahashii TaxID=29030 RepID=UPI001CF7ED72|nr:phospholipase A2 inhibitor-like [Drosophila takahashii]